MAKIDYTYHNLLEKILQEGYDYKDESRDVMCKQISSYEFRHNMKNGFPAITTKKLYWKGVVGELIWFLRGDTNIKYLIDNNIHIWDKDAYNFYKNIYKQQHPKLVNTLMMNFETFIYHLNKNISCNHLNNYEFGDLGRIYGAQWRDWQGDFKINENNSGEHTIIDQISNLIQNLKDKPMSRRHIVAAWNPAELDNMALPPCHWSFEILPRPLSLDERGTKLINMFGYQNFEIQNGFGKLQFSDEQEEYLDKLNVPKYTFDLKWHQRSVDTFLGLPFNIASYGLLMEIIGKLTNMIPNELIGDLSNVHIYHPHIKAVKTQLKNSPDKYWKSINLLMKDEFHYITDEKLVRKVLIDKIFNEMQIDWFKLENYESYPAITAEMLAPI